MEKNEENDMNQSMHEYKYTGRRWRGADHPADGFLTGISLFVAVMALLFYVLALVP